MKRVGKRGEGKFARISWDEALDKIAAEIPAHQGRLRQRRPSTSPTARAATTRLNGRQTAERLMNLFGGSLGFYNSYSWAAISAATPTVYGTSVTGNQRQDWLNSKYILMWSWNPAEMRDGTNSEYLRPQGPREGRPRRLHRPADDAERRGPGRRVGAHPPGHGRGHDVGHGLRHDHREPLRRRLRPDPLRRLRRVADAARGGGRRELQGLHPRRRATASPKTPEWAEAIMRRPARDDRPPRPRIRHDQARRPLPGLRHAAAGLRRAGRPGRLRPGRASPATSAFPAAGPAASPSRPPTAGPLWLVFPTGDEPGQGQDPELPLDRGGPPRQGAWAPADGVRGADEARHRHQVHLGRGLQLPRQPARQHQPDGPHPAPTRSRSSSSSSRTTS